MYMYVCVTGPDVWSLELFSTPTTLCIPNTVFGYQEAHRYNLEDGDVFAKKLENSLKNSDLGFDVWALYYYPNVRDVLIAKVASMHVTCTLLVACPCTVR